MSRGRKQKVVPEDSGNGPTPILPGAETPEMAASPPQGFRYLTEGLNDRLMVLAVCILLAAMIWCVFGQTLQYGFVNYDDEHFVYQNPAVQKGLSWEGIHWAFTHFYTDNWYPLTWISHMLDCEFYGLNAGGHHLTSVLLHIATAILLFLVLRRMSGLLWRSAFVAAVFAVHPLRVESVAWIAERKDVLSGVFFMLTIGAYLRYARGQMGNGKRQIAFYFLALVLFALGLMCKPMLVTLPLLLLLLDYWPLRRDSGWKQALAEKMPFFAMSAAVGVVTILAQRPALQTFETVPLPLRLGNALVSCVGYLGQMFWPEQLAVLYPLPVRGIGMTAVALSFVTLAAITALAFAMRRRRPWFLVGWLWYLVMLLPVIGVIQVGLQAHADRYTYLPQIGLYLVLTWAAADLCSAWRLGHVGAGGGAAAILAILIVCARQQAAYWRNSETLWTHTLACTSDNVIAENNLGDTLYAMGKVDEAIPHFQRALQIQPDSAQALNNLGTVQAGKRNWNEAIAFYQKSLQIQPDSVESQRNLANALLQKGDISQALACFQKLLQTNPDVAQAHCDFAGALLQKGNLDEAEVHCQIALQANPGLADAHLTLGNTLLQKGKVAEAIVHYRQVLASRPDSLVVLNNLAWILATSPDAHLRNGAQALQYARRACELTRDTVPSFLGTQAAAYAEMGRFSDAVATAQKAEDLALAMGQSDVAASTERSLKLYKSGRPFHEDSAVVP